MTILTLFESLGRTLVAWSLQLTVLIAFVCLALACDRRHRPELRHRLLVLGLLFSFTLPFVTDGIAALHWTSQLKAVVMKPPAQGTTSPLAKPAVEQPGSFAAPAIATSRTIATDSFGNVFPIVGFLWLVGFSIVSVRKLRECRRLAQVVRRADPAPRVEQLVGYSPITLLSNEISSPMLYGWWRPVILLPKDILEWSSTTDLLMVVRHEFVHFIRKDHWVSLLETLLRAVLFFHPLVRWMCHQLDIERELACDAEILRTGLDPESYAETLLLVAERAVANDAGIQFAAAAQLNRRIELLFQPRTRPRIALCVAPFLLLTPLAVLGFWQAQVERIPQIASVTWTRLLSPPPQAAVPLRPAVSVPLPFRPVRLQPTERQTQAPSSPSVITSVTYLRGQGEEEEVRITMGIPFSLLPFEDRKSASGSQGRQAHVQLEGRIASISGRVVARVDDPIDVLVPKSAFRPEGMAVFQKAFLLSPGAYSFLLTSGNPATANSWSFERRFEVPRISGRALSTSSLILAEMIDVGRQVGMFNIGNIAVRPNVTGKFRAGQSLNVFQKVYSDGPGPLTMDLRIIAQGNEFKRLSEELLQSSDFTIIKTFPLADFTPGAYEIQITVTNPNTRQSVVSKGEFTVE